MAWTSVHDVPSSAFGKIRDCGGAGMRVYLTDKMQGKSASATMRGRWVICGPKNTVFPYSEALWKPFNQCTRCLSLCWYTILKTI